MFDAIFNSKRISSVTSAIFLIFVFFLAGLLLYNYSYQGLRIKILNPEFHPLKNGNWTVFFETSGTSSLAIILNNSATRQDMDFSYVACKGRKVSNAYFDGKKIILPQWFCSGQGALVFKVKKLGNHELKFDFGGKLVYAHNSSVSDYDFSVSSSVSRMAYYGKDTANDVPVDTASSSWNVAGAQFTTQMYADANSSNDVYASTTDNSSSTFKQIVHDFYFKINEAVANVEQVDLQWEGRGTRNEEIAADNDVRMYIYNFNSSAWRPIASSLDNACNSSDCTLTHSTTTNISNFFDAGKGLRFMVQKYEAGHNCSSSPTTITCGKNVTSTTYNTGCTYQASTQDLWNQCATSSNSCLTGNCDGTIFSCGSYNDWQQHSCNTCYGCAGGPDCIPQSTLPGYGSTYGCTGTTDAECATCTAGTCETTSCEGLQCNCQAGYCVSGVCVRNCLSLCQSQGFANGSCYPDEMSCWMAGGFPNGDVDCTMPDRLCCCFY